MICEKKFGSYPASHRVYNHDGHCARIHGHNWNFVFTFDGTPDDRGFVVDFGSLKWLRNDLENMFDHTILLSPSDPEAQTFRAMALQGLCRPIFLPSVSCEGIAKHLGDTYSSRFGKARLVSVTVIENEVNSATYICP